MAEIKFTLKEHENFYKEMLQKSGKSDSYHRVFFYCIGISETGRRNVTRVFDFEQDRIIPDGLHEAWQTGERCGLQGLRSTYGIDMWNRGRKVCRLSMRYLTATMPRISMKPYAYVIRNIAGNYRKTGKQAAGGR